MDAEGNPVSRLGSKQDSMEMEDDIVRLLGVEKADHGPPSAPTSPANAA